MNRVLSRSIRTVLATVGVNAVGQSVHGRKYVVPLGCTSLKHLFIRRDNNYEGDFYNYVLNLVAPGHIVFDIGAHLGKYAIGLAPRIRPGGKLVAFEANPVTAGYLQQIVALNGLGDVASVVTAAVGDQVGHLKITIKGQACDPGQTAFEHHSDADHDVAMTTVDHYVAQTGHCPNMLKIDVEGYELKVLAGARTTLANSAPIVCCEVHPQQLARLGHGPADVEQFLIELGYASLSESRYAHREFNDRKPFNIVFRKK